ncbi:venom carboxylesterase-6-like isoform X2 [Penaeus chinensis]|uniref:venom carboxylesterase-6-like isoform X2 n=1 Tax=Penaeus chinensis TaxID=139456 RepID=UPI001FB7B0D5|nr:venom carboxylesterase-6-like isoform X2 [Penaeus chinensis]
MEPQPAEAWTGVRNGSLPVPKCTQISLSMFQGGEVQIEGQEDCLHLSVFTPRPYASDLPVMVWIHGGGFFLGGAEEYRPSPLMTRGVVVVLIQYRLGTLGFLSTEDSELPGNLGLQDQTLALRWVKDNIRDLGGDPDKVTIFGESAGGASVHFHVLSPMSEGLFNRAIMQSGTMLCPWAMREGHRGVAARLGEIFDCPGESAEPALDSAALLTCLRGVPAEALIDVQREFNIWGFSPQVMLPRVDGVFLPDHPATLLREGRYNKVDIISGITSHEGTIFTTPLLSSPDLSELVLKNFSVAGPLGMIVEQEDDPEYLARRAYHHYLGSPLQLTMEKAEEFIQLMTDRMFAMCHLDALKHHQRDEAFGNHVFFYELQHRGEFSFVEMFSGPSEIGKGWIGHGDDLQYFFDPDIGEFHTRPRGRPAGEADHAGSLDRLRRHRAPDARPHAGLPLGTDHEGQRRLFVPHSSAGYESLQQP